MKDRERFSLKEAFLKGLTELLVICLAILFFFVIFKFDDIMLLVRKICSILTPVIIGVVLAYLIAPMVNFFEEKLDAIVERTQNRKEKPVSGSSGIKKFITDANHRIEDAFQKAESLLPLKFGKKSSKKKKGKFPSRLIAIFITLAILGLFFFFLIWMVVPQIYFNIRRLVFALPWQLNHLVDKLQELFAGNAKAEDWLNQMYGEAETFITNWLKQDMLDQVSLIISGVMNLVNSMLNFVIGIIVAIYVLLSKETFKRQFKKILHAFLSEETSGQILDVLRESDRIFGGFITGKIIDSLIVGIICFIGVSLLKMPYIALVSVVVGVTNIIPFFGPYLGGIPCACLILLADPKKGIIFIIFIMLLQQIDGNIIGPTILGESTGLSPFWVMFSILLGGGLFGIIGMLIGVPTFGVIYYLFKSLVNYKIERKEQET